MKIVSGKEMCRILERHGWRLRRVRGSHHIYADSRGASIAIVPVHRNKDLSVGLIRSILNQAGLTPNDLE